MYDEQIRKLRELASIPTHCENVESCDGCSKEDICLRFTNERIIKTASEAADAIESTSKAYQMMAEAYEAEVTKPKWIPVTERLPNCNGCYLVWRPHFFGGEIGMPSICYFDGSNTWHDSYGVDFERILHPDDITHWMPLPEPPESGDKL